MYCVFYRETYGNDSVPCQNREERSQKFHKLCLFARASVVVQVKTRNPHSSCILFTEAFEQTSQVFFFFFFLVFFSAATLYNLCELVVEFKKAVSRPCCLFVFTSCCCFHCLFSHLQALFSANPPSSLAGAARPTSHSKPNTEKEPTGSQVELLLLDVFLQALRPESKSILFRK